ncbi:DUF63 family protein [Halalkalicoccus salilacus]|uniref:DUF63 family protein n=1 Tax=Halalkalicoccus TaxID=332246 RepID=UPI002F96D327
MVLPDGFALPPLSYLLVLLLAAAAVGSLVARVRPPIRERTVFAFALWMVVGAALHVLSVIDAAPGAITPLLGTPSVYVSTFVLAGAVWVAGAAVDAPDRLLATLGALAALAAVGGVLAVGIERETLVLFWSIVALALSVLVTAGAWAGFRLAVPTPARTTGAAGVLVVFAHVLDGVSTAVGIDVLEVTERSPLPRMIMEFARTLPTAEAIGVGWLFVLVKVAIALGIVWLMAEYVEDAPGEGYLLLGAIAAVGLGPGVHNLLLFAIGG